MTTKRLLAEELHPLLDLMPAVEITEENLGVVRAVGVDEELSG